MIIGIKPLGHLTGMYATAGTVAIGAASGHAEVSVQVAAIGFFDAPGDMSQGEAHVQNLIVQREITHRQQIEGSLQLPVAGADIPGGRQ